MLSGITSDINSCKKGIIRAVFITVAEDLTTSCPGLSRWRLQMGGIVLRNCVDYILSWEKKTARKVDRRTPALFNKKRLEDS